MPIAPVPERLYVNSGVATAIAGSAKLPQPSGIVTSEALTTASGAIYTLTLTNKYIAANSVVLASICNGTNTQGKPTLGTITPATGSAVIKIRNDHASEAFNGTIKISFFVMNSRVI